MSVDAQRIQDLVNYLHLIWSSAYQMGVIVYLLYWTVGWAAFAGVGVMILMMPLNAWLYLLYQKYEKKYMEHKDSRIKLMNELLNGIRVIKLYAWENTFLRQILATRNDLELDMLKKIGYVSAVETFTWSATPFLVSLSTFTLYTLVMKQTLTTDILFSAIALFNLLKMPLSALPWVLRYDFSPWHIGVVLYQRVNYLCLPTLACFQFLCRGSCLNEPFIQVLDGFRNRSLFHRH
jgi:ABC-type bacteriocin/lantibiotic exporter with double-glycine peptidase domain